MAAKGGKRPGAGRKPNEINLLRKSAALGLLSEVEEKNQWRRFLKSDNEDIAFKAFMAWQDRAFGRPNQAVALSGEGGRPVRFEIERMGLADRISRARERDD